MISSVFNLFSPENWSIWKAYVQPPPPRLGNHAPAVCPIPEEGPTRFRDQSCKVRTKEEEIAVTNGRTQMSEKGLAKIRVFHCIWCHRDKGKGGMWDFQVSKAFNFLRKLIFLWLIGAEQLPYSFSTNCYWLNQIKNLDFDVCKYA